MTTANSTSTRTGARRRTPALRTARVADLISQMTPEEEVGLLFCVSANLDTARSLIPDFKNNCMLFNLNGTPIEVTNTLNNLQATAEAERLSIPMTFTSDREYNSWGGYIDKARQRQRS